MILIGFTMTKCDDCDNEATLVVSNDGSHYGYAYCVKCWHEILDLAESFHLLLGLRDDRPMWTAKEI